MIFVIYYNRLEIITYIVYSPTLLIFVVIYLVCPFFVERVLFSSIYSVSTVLYMGVILFNALALFIT